MTCPAPSTATPLPLEGIRVIDFTWIHAGPSATRILADQGAQVIKIESSQALSIAGGPIPRTTIGVGQRHNWNAGKLSVTLNMRTPGGLDLAKRLVRISDVVAENFSSRVMPAWGMDYPSLRKIKPDIIMLSMSAMGRTGVWKEYVSYGQTLQAWSGFTELTGFPETDPSGPASAYSDATGGMAGAQGVLLALLHRARTGRGQMVDLSQFETMSSLLGPLFLELTVNKKADAIQRGGNCLPHSTAAPHGAYRCRGDERWVAITVFTEDEWLAFVDAVGNPPWCQKPEFASAEARHRHADALDPLVESWTRQHTAEEVMRLLQDAGVAAGVVQTGRDLVDNDPQLRDRGFYRRIPGSVPDWFMSTGDAIPGVPGPIATGEGGGPGDGAPNASRTGGHVPATVTVEGPPYRLSASNGGPRQGGPTLGQHQNLVLKELLGLSDEEIAEHAINGVFE